MYASNPSTAKPLSLPPPYPASPDTKETTFKRIFRWLGNVPPAPIQNEPIGMAGAYVLPLPESPEPKTIEERLKAMQKEIDDLQYYRQNFSGTLSDFKRQLDGYGPTILSREAPVVELKTELMRTMSRVEDVHERLEVAGKVIAGVIPPKAIVPRPLRLRVKEEINVPAGAEV